MLRNLNINEEIFINQYSQDLHTLKEMDDWFLSYKLNDKKDILHNLIIMVIQSKAGYDDINYAAKLLGLLKSTSAVKLLNTNKPFIKFGYEICNLQENELLKGFSIMLETLKIADIRRRNLEESDKCNHWWHKDLSDEDYLNEIRNMFK